MAAECLGLAFLLLVRPPTSSPEAHCSVARSPNHVCRAPTHATTHTFANPLISAESLGRRAWQIIFALVGLVVAMVYGCALLRRAVQRHVRYIWMRGKAQEVIVVDLRDRVGFETA